MFQDILTFARVVESNSDIDVTNVQKEAYPCTHARVGQRFIERFVQLRWGAANEPSVGVSVSVRSG